MIDVLLIRHAIAEDRDSAQASGTLDADRALTQKGRRRMTVAADGLRSVIDGIAVIGTSPFRRAVQTAEVVAAAFSPARVVELPALAPGGDILEIAAWVARQNSGPVALVGHEPDLGQWAGWALAGASHTMVRFKKGGVCCLRFDRDAEAGTAVLQWALAPAQLRQLGE